MSIKRKSVDHLGIEKTAARNPSKPTNFWKISAVYNVLDNWYRK